MTPTQTTVWTNKVDFVMAAISSAIGLGNLWRFPYVCYKNGGGAFLVPFLVMIMVAGFPQVLSDVALGQYGRSGAVRSYRATPIMMGVGWLLLLVSIYVDVYYMVVVSYTVFYTFASFTRRLPWDSCGNWWNTEACRDARMMALERNCTSYNGSWVHNICYLSTSLVQNVSNSTNNSSISTGKSVDTSEEYFNNYVLQLSSGISDIGAPRWPIVLCVILVLLLTLVTLSLGVKTWGKLAYVFTLVPYVILVALLVQSLLHNGATDGILYFLTPRWGELANPQVWVDAVGQAFFSLSCVGGALITIGSYNPFRNDCLRDAAVVTVGDTLTSLLCGVVVFSILGLMAHDLHVSIDDVVGKGAGMAFVVYSAALARLPSAPVWSAVFMIMLVNLGVGTMVSVIATLQKAMVEELPAHLQGRRLHQTLVLITVLTIFFVLGLIYTTNGGMYVLQMMDGNATYLLLVTGIIKCLTVTWAYGIDRLYDDMQTMSGSRPCQVLAWTHKFVTPALLVFVIVFNFTNLKPLMYRDYVFPAWAEALGWILTITTLLVVPGVAVYKIYKVPGGLPINMRIRALCEPASDWEYSEEKHANGVAMELLATPNSTEQTGANRHL